MKQNRITTISEYQEISLSELDDKIKGNTMNLLKKVNELNKTEVFKLFHNKIKATQYVGFVKVKNHTIQVVPKIMKDNSDNIQFLIQMLKYTQKLNMKEQGTANLNKIKDDFFEILIYMFAKNLRELLKNDFRKTYVEQEENVSFLKGKLIIKENIRQNMVNQTKYYCKFDDFTENNLMNQIFKFTTNILFQVTRSSSNKKMLEEILSYLSDVEYKHIQLSDFSKIHITRLNNKYEPILNLCKLFIQNSAIEFSFSKIESFVFMFDMNRLFEEFVYRFVRKHKSRINISNYTTIELVKEQFQVGKLYGKFNMKVDVLLKDENNKSLLIDTKYKLLKEELTHQGVSQSDVYQMFAYSSSQKNIYRDIVLLYPATTEIKESVTQSTIKHILKDETTVNIHIRMVDLSRIFNVENKRIDENNMLEEMNKALQVET